LTSENMNVPAEHTFGIPTAKDIGQSAKSGLETHEDTHRSLLRLWARSS